MHRDRKTVADYQKLVDDRYGPGRYHLLERIREADATILNANKLKIRCVLHGEEFIVPLWKVRNKNFLDCSECRAEHVASGVARENYIRAAIQEIIDAWPDEGYDFSKTRDSYMRQFLIGDERPEVTVVCPIHGDFTGTFYHIKKYGCMACGTEGVYGRHSMRYQNRDQLIAQLRLIHGNAYDLSRVQFVPVRYGNKVEVGCEHGWNSIPVATLLNGGGCFYCSQARVKRERAAGTFKPWWGKKRKPTPESEAFSKQFKTNKEEK